MKDKQITSWLGTYIKFFTINNILLNTYNTVEPG